MHSTCCGRARACAGARRQLARGRTHGGERRGEPRRRLGERRSGCGKRGESGSKWRKRVSFRAMRKGRTSQRRFTAVRVQTSERRRRFKTNTRPGSQQRIRGFWGACERKTQERGAGSRQLQETGEECRCGRGSTSRQHCREMRLSADRGEVREREVECRILGHKVPLKALLGVGTHASALG